MSRRFRGAALGLAAIALLAIVVVATVAAGTSLLWVLAALLLFVFFNVAIRAWQGAAAIRQFRRRYGRDGKDLLLVYSRSPHWQAYVESEWLPRWGSRAVVVDWSDRERFSGREPEVVLFRSVSGSREYNPIAVVVPSSGPVHVFRFWRAFRDRNLGREHALRAMEAELEAALAAQDPVEPTSS
jgi:hypothetical protein